MGLYFEPFAVVGTFGLLLGWFLAVVVWMKGGGRAQSRFLSLIIAMLSTGWGISVGLMFMADDAGTSLALQAVGIVFIFAELPIYVLFLSTLPTRWMAWARPLPVRIGLGVASVALAAFSLVRYADLHAGVVAVPYARQDVVYTDLAILLLEINSILTATFGIVAALLTVRESRPGTPARRQAKSYSLAFIWFDAIQLAAWGVMEFAFRTSPPVIVLYTIAAAFIMPIAFIGFLLLLAYGILRFQLFDIDLKIKVGLRRGFVVAPVAVAFFIATETLEGLLPFSSYWAGLAVAGGITLAVTPLHQGATRLADRIMPTVQDTPEYRERRGHDIYRAALEAARFDGEVTPKEKRMLERLAAEFGLDSSAVAGIERSA